MIILFYFTCFCFQLLKWWVLLIIVSGLFQIQEILSSADLKMTRRQISNIIHSPSKHVHSFVHTIHKCSWPLTHSDTHIKSTWKVSSYFILMNERAFIEQWNLSPLQSALLGTSCTYPTQHFTPIPNSLRSSPSRSPSAALLHS